MKLDQLKIPGLKPRNPNQEVLAAKRNAGGPMRDKKQEQKRGETKHRQVYEGKDTMYQVRIADSDWKDLDLHAASLEDIADAVKTPPHKYTGTKFDLGTLTEIVESWIGAGPNGGRDMYDYWDEMEYSFKSLKDDVLKIYYEFSGMSRQHDQRERVAKDGIITIMPAA